MENINLTSENTNRNSAILFVQNEEPREILRIAQNGDIFVKGKLIENDKEVVEALRDFLIKQGYDHLKK